MQIIHFAVYVLGSLVFFSVCWLYLDAWKQSHKRHDFMRIVGLGLLACSYALNAIHVESNVFSGMLFGFLSLPLLSMGVRVGGALLFVASLAVEPLVDRPDTAPAFTGASIIVPAAFGASVFASILLTAASPVLLGCAALLYLRRSTIGLERHVRPVAWAFAVLACAELLALRGLFEITTNSLLYAWVLPFGPLWVLEHVVYLIGVLMLGKWVIHYLFKQFETQLFMIFTLMNLLLFIVTTLSFTGLLLMNMERDARDQITTDVKVLQFTLRSQQAQLLSDAQVGAKNDMLIDALSRGDASKGRQIATDMIMAKNISSLIVVTDAGVVFSRAEDSERIGDSLSEDSLVKHALLGESVSSIVSQQGVLAPTIVLRAATPVRNSSGEIIGAIIFGNAIDTAFVDGLKKATGFEVSVYGGDAVSATSFTHGTTTDRAIGKKETDARVHTQVLEKGQIYAGSVSVQNELYIGAFAPLTDIDTNVVGMLFVGRPETAILEAAGRSIQYTFFIAVILLLLSILPAYRVARYLSDQL